MGSPPRGAGTRVGAMNAEASLTLSPRGEDAARWLDGKQAAMEERIATLVNVNSFTDNTDGGRKVGKLLGELFAVRGLTPAVKPSARYADHLVFASRAGVSAPSVALVGHLDTVFPPGTFEGYRRDGDLARGPGVLDMKGGLVVVAFAVHALAETCGLDAIAPLRIGIVADEEVGSPEGQAVLREGIAGAGAALVFEAGRTSPPDAIITRRKGTGGMTARAYGKAAHAGNNHKEGVNALWAIARFVDRVQQLTQYDRGITVNVGKIAGGQGKNTVPDEAEAAVDLRFCTSEDAEALVVAVRRAAEEAAASVPGARIELEGGIARHPLERTDASAALMRAYATCARASSLGGDEAPLIGGGSDASTSSSMGIASIDGLGPRGSGFHTKDERIEVATLVPKAQALARFLASWSA
jgi:glutamate carboxypeptidase